MNPNTNAMQKLRICMLVGIAARELLVHTKFPLIAYPFAQVVQIPLANDWQLLLLFVVHALAAKLYPLTHIAQIPLPQYIQLAIEHVPLLHLALLSMTKFCLQYEQVDDVGSEGIAQFDVNALQVFPSR